VENVILGRKPPRWPFLDLQRAKEEVGDLSKRYHFNIDLDAKISQISVGMQQRVEIVKALFREARLLILDEPTSVLTPQETDELIAILKKLAAGGLSIVFISHKLEEVMNLCDRITVLRAGSVVATVSAKEASKTSLARMMVGRELLDQTVRSKDAGKEVILDVDRVTATNTRGLVTLKNASFQLREGEIFGIAGVDGNGQVELAEVIAGLRKPTEGTIKLRGVDMTHVSGNRRKQMGVGYIPENRQKRGLVLTFPVGQNLILKSATHPIFAYRGMIFRFHQIKTNTDTMIRKFDIRGPGRDAPVMTYSGGNQQKIVLAREFQLQPLLLVAAQPTRGLDVGATEFVHQQLVEFAEEGNGVLLISTDLEEILSLTQRFAVMYEGEVVGTVGNKGPIDLGEIGLMMAGSKRLHNSEQYA
jgi:simple sugar transport system ATP-binding protein